MSERRWQFDPAQHKTDADVYFIRTVDAFSWGYFFVHASGILMAYTDFGNYAYAWPGICRDEDLKTFLTRIDTHYLLGKIARRDFLDERATTKGFVKELLYRRRQNSVSRDRAREMYDEIYNTEPRDLIRWGMEQPEFDPACWELARYDYSPQAKAFVESLWPQFIQALKSELAAGNTEEVRA